MSKHAPSMNASQRNIVARGDDNPPRRGTFPVPLLVNSQFDDPSGSEERGSRPTVEKTFSNGYTSAQVQGNIPSDDVARHDLRNFGRTNQGRGRKTGKVR